MRFHFITVFILGSFALTNGCNCEDEPIKEVEAAFTCDIKTCDDGDAYRNGACLPEGCENDQDCCPGTRCRTDLNICWPFELETDFACESDGDCDDPAMRCVETVIGDRQPLRICQFDDCESDETCGKGQSCFHGVCVATAPCVSSCETGTVCDVRSGWCTAVPDDALGCDESCNVDEVMVLEDPVGMRGEACCEIHCTCVTRPPIQPTRYGPFTQVASSLDKVWVATYEEAFGDLLVIQYDHDGNELRAEIVDGVPLDGLVSGDPNGPRNGIAEPGPDVGPFLSLTLTLGGLPRIAYFDATNKSLKFAAYDGASWQIHVIDAPLDSDENGFVGKETAIAIDAQSGGLLVAYHYGNLAFNDGRTASGLRLAKSSLTTPSANVDWTYTELERHWPMGGCGQGCALDEVCVEDVEAASCAVVSENCGACGAGQACVAERVDGGVSATGSCADVALDFQEGPVVAAGLNNKVFSDDRGSYIGTYDGRLGSLNLISVYTDGTWEKEVLDGAGFGAHPEHDVGRSLDIVRYEGQLLVSFVDFTTHAFRYWLGDPLADNGIFGVIDDGQRLDTPGLSFVGAGGQMTVSVTGLPTVVYQDATYLDLKMASYQNGAWAPRNLLSTGSHGFFSDIAVYGNKAFIVAMEEQLDARGINQPYLWFLVEQIP